MNEIALRVENLGKRYRIGHAQPRYDTLRDAIGSVFKRSNIPPFQPSDGTDTIWALKGVSFEVKRGEVVGIIGRNGAGKSTLLKILSRITAPTEGYAEIHGRVGTLLEVGTGFHGELSGRENIYLSGAILGMKQTEIERRFDEIVAFAEIEKFIDTPAKYYSSGMYVRLAFAVAAHLEPEILLVDEVLAVGDAAFQKKCLGKMGDVAKDGRTVLFVSHNMQAIARLCSRSVLLEKGRVGRTGDTHDVVAAYVHSGYASLSEKAWTDLNEAPGNDTVRLIRVRVRNRAGEVQRVFDSRQPIGIDIGYTVRVPVKDLAAEIFVYNEDGTLLFPSANQYDPELLSLHKPGTYLSTCWIPGNLMTEGIFFVRVSIAEIRVPLKVHVLEEDILMFQVTDHLEGDSARGRIAHHYPGVIRPKLDWSTEFLGELAARK